MSQYEKLRLLVSALQIIATIIAPLLVVFYMEQRRKRNER
jgi:hypothetical protein